jgi:HEAT repeat protein
MRNSTTLAMIITVAALTAFAAPSLAQRRIDAAKQAKSLFDKLPAARGETAAKVEEQIATLATDLMYMDQVQPVLVKQLSSRNTRQRATAARLLRYVFSGGAIAPLTRTIAKDRSADVRVEAVTSLCILKADEAAGALRTVSTGDRNEKVRASAKAALDVIENREGARKAGCRRALQRRMAAIL